MKIQFIICGWHMNRKSLIDGLYELQKQNKDTVGVFWSCHREPTDEIKQKFNHKLFFNGGEEYGAYQQGVEHLNLDDDTICFFLHDDLVLKSFDLTLTFSEVSAPMNLDIYVAIEVAIIAKIII